MKKKFNEYLVYQERVINLLVIALGVILVLVAVILHEYDFWNSFLLSIGCSILATGIVTYVTSSYMISRREKTEIIDEWKLQAIFPTKTKMNEKSNECLDNANNSIDIVAIGMSNFLNVKQNILEEKLKKNVAIRIISCNNESMLRQRELDESRSRTTNNTMSDQVKELTRWVNGLAGNYSIRIKYHSTYPSFSYLRIDDTVFWGPNLPLYYSQQNFAFEFKINGEGGKILSRYFDQLWNDTNICSDELN